MKTAAAWTDFSALFEILGEVERPGTFCVSGQVETSVPDVQIEGVGQLSFPLPVEQARRIIEVADRAPYGRGGETLVDTDVRRTWQIAPERIQLRDKRWGSTLRAIVERVCAGLGGSGESVRAELYKGLLYDQGGFFVEHRDTEKAKGMFATLVVVLPSPFRGGELVVRHQDQEMTLALPGQDLGQVSYGAFYADCRHELRPVTEGHRLCLIYNLIRGKGASTLAPPDYRAETQSAAAFLASWTGALRPPEATAGEGPPRKLLYVLEHHYTPENLSFAGLKNGDTAVAAVLRSAARQAGCDLSLAMVSIKESGPAEPIWSGRGRRRYHHEADQDHEAFEVIEVSERVQAVEHWLAPDDSPMGLRELPFAERELCPPDALEGEEPDEKHFSEATGNEGGSFERTYRRAALVLWPRQLRVDVLLEARPFDVLPLLRRCLEPSDPLAISRLALNHDETVALTSGLIARWPRRPTDRPYLADETSNAELLACLLRLQEPGLLRRFMSDIVVPLRYNGQENGALAETCRRFGWEVFGPLLVTLITRHQRPWFVRCAELLGLLHPLAQTPEALRAWRVAARELVAGLPGNKAAIHHADEDLDEEDLDVEDLADDLDELGDTPKASVDTLVASLNLFWTTEETSLAHAVVEHVLAHEVAYPPDRLVRPALSVLFAQHGRKVLESPGFEQLQRAVVSFLEARSGQPLEAPRDWTREAKLSCRCEDCAALATFLADAKVPQWRLRAALERRKHVERQIRHDGCDLDGTTERRGSPHTLVCTKNQRTYEQRCAQRATDLEGLVEMHAMGS